MLTVRDLMTEDLVTVTPSDTLRDAAEVMADEHFSGLPVVDGGEAVGVISATDLLSFVADASGAEIERSRGGGVERIPEGRQWEEGGEIPTGYFLDDWAEDRYGFEEFLPETGRPEWNVLEEHTVAESMTRSVHSIAPGATVREAARAMLDARIRRVLVVEDGQLVGVLTATDVMEAVADRGVGARG